MSMKENHLPRKTMYCELVNGKCSDTASGQIRFKYGLLATLKKIDHVPPNLEAHVATD